ncbi:serine/threonine-protein kinase [Streptomyces sp. NPDC002467]|uniref:serine/threonine-protein kinase n=1 Tax=Streptomyces sp. NPDC002467 TaxID=3364647 RepID=UPI00368CB5EA
MRPLRDSDPAATGPYRLLAELGRGGMGRVLLGAAPDGRLVAVKQVHARFAADDAFRARFRREVAASRKVSGAYTAAVMDADADAATPWLASVFVSGPSLGAAVEASGPLPEETVRCLAAGLATALIEIHRVGLVHRDLKPDNVLLAEDGVRVIDFGIARAVEAGDATELTQTGLVVGSPAFMSPEQAEGAELTPASDVFSLGSVLALAVTGRSPFAGTSTLQTLFNLVHAEPDLGAVPPGPLRRAVEWCLAKDPAARPTPVQLLGLLGPVVAGAAGGRLPAVRGMIEAQRAEIDRLLAGPDRTAVPQSAEGPRSPQRPQPPVWLRKQAAVDAAPPTAPPTAPYTQVVATGSGRRPRRPAVLALAGVLAVAPVGGGAYWLTNGDASAGGSAVPDKYAKSPVCEEAAGKLPLPAADRRKDKDVHHEEAEEAKTMCEWRGAPYVVDGRQYEPQDPHALVSWDLKRSTESKGNATKIQREDFSGTDKGDTPETGVGVGDGAFWGAHWYRENCSLVVRDGNLVVQVVLYGDEHPPERCQADAKEIARAAVAAMPG